VSNSIQRVLLRLHKLISTVLFPNTVYVAGERWHRRYLSRSGTRRMFSRMLIYVHRFWRTLRIFIFICNELLSEFHGFSFIRIMSASCNDECLMFGLGWTEQETRQHLSLTTGTKKHERSRQCGAGSSREEPRSEKASVAQPGLRDIKGTGPWALNGPGGFNGEHHPPSGSSSSSSPSTASPPEEVFRLNRRRSSSGRWNEVLRLELLLPAELERCLEVKEALRSSEPVASGSSVSCASGDIVCCPSTLLVMDAGSSTTKAGEDGVGGFEFRRSRLNPGISIREYEHQKSVC